MLNVITPPPKPDNDIPSIFTEEGKQLAFKAIDKGVKYGKVLFPYSLGSFSV
jgi:hypothetical protein